VTARVCDERIEFLALVLSGASCSASAKHGIRLAHSFRPSVPYGTCAITATVRSRASPTTRRACHEAAGLGAAVTRWPVRNVCSGLDAFPEVVE
jgi:hypothetical protein